MIKVASKTAQTKEDYIKRAILLQRKALTEMTKLFGAPPQSEVKKITLNGKVYSTLNIKETTNYACDFLAKTVSKSTWRYYRSSLNHYATFCSERGILSAIDLSFIRKKLKETKASELKFNRTSSQKKKYLPEDELKAISTELSTSKSKYAILLEAWLYVNSLVGLRPCEWAETEIVKIHGKRTLLIKNAKVTNGRSHGKTRLISLSHFTSQQHKNILNFSLHMSTAHKNDKFKSLYQGCRRLLQALNKRLWKHRNKNITLYSTRHQFSADMKKSGGSLLEIAYLMGHGSTDTSTSHYGKKRYGRSMLMPQVDAKLTTNITPNFKPFSFADRVKTPKAKVSKT